MTTTTTRTRVDPSDRVVVGDVHGCLDELDALLDLVFLGGYHPDQVVFLGDLVDRGPRSGAVVARVRDLVQNQGARCVSGNHDHKHVRYHRHETRRVSDPRYQNPMAQTFKHKEEYQDVLETDPSLFRFLEGLPTLLRLPGGRTCVHAGVSDTRKVDQAFLMHVRYVNPDTGSMVSLGKDFQQPPGTVHWTERYTGPDTVFFGHDIRSLTVPQVFVSRGGARCYAVDTGCYAGGYLTAVSTLDPEGTRFQIKSQQPDTTRETP